MAATKPTAGSIYNSAAADINPNQPYSTQISGQILGQAAPGIAAGQLGEASALESAGLTPGEIASGAANLTSNAGYAYDQALGNFESIGLQGQSLGTQIGTAAQQQGIEKSQYQNQLQQLGLTQSGIGYQQQYLGTQQSQSDQGFALQGQSLASQQGYLGTESQQSAQGNVLAQAQIANQQQELAYQTPLALQAQSGQAAASGASNTVGNKNALGTIQEQANTQGTQLGLESQQANLAQAQAQAGFTQQGTQLGLQQQENTLSQQEADAGFTEQGQQLGIQAQQNSLATQLAGLGQQSEVAGYHGQQAQYANAQQQLALGAQQAGIPAQQATSQLQYGLGQLGLQYDPTSFLTQAATSEGSTANAYSAALSAASVAGGLSPQSFATKG